MARDDRNHDAPGAAVPQPTHRLSKPPASTEHQPRRFNSRSRSRDRTHHQPIRPHSRRRRSRSRSRQPRHSSPPRNRRRSRTRSRSRQRKRPQSPGRSSSRRRGMHRSRETSRHLRRDRDSHRHHRRVSPARRLRPQRPPSRSRRGLPRYPLRSHSRSRSRSQGRYGHSQRSPPRTRSRSIRSHRDHRYNAPADRPRSPHRPRHHRPMVPSDRLHHRPRANSPPASADIQSHLDRYKDYARYHRSNRTAASPDERHARDTRPTRSSSQSRPRRSPDHGCGASGRRKDEEPRNGHRTKPSTSHRHLRSTRHDDENQSVATGSNGHGHLDEDEAMAVDDDEDDGAGGINVALSTSSPGLHQPSQAESTPRQPPQYRPPFQYIPGCLHAARGSPPSNIDDYERLRQVGEGTYGKVYKARRRPQSSPPSSPRSPTPLVALKRIRMESEREGFPITAMREIKLLTSLNHPNIVNLLETLAAKDGSIYMIFEYMDYDLAGLIAHPQWHLEVPHIKCLMHQMLSGLAYLHDKGVLHRDIKGSNLLLNQNGQLKFTDFGLARRFDPTHMHDYTNRVITLWYRPPELLLGATLYGPPADLWGLGCLMLELFTRKPAFAGVDEISQLDAIYRVLGTPTAMTTLASTTASTSPVSPHNTTHKSGGTDDNYHAKQTP
ncbi:kinase subunit of RNA polymerase II carboxy-terminal domain kinase I, partial [Dimargaris verticillata]